MPFTNKHRFFCADVTSLHPNISIVLTNSNLELKKSNVEFKKIKCGIKAFKKNN